AAHYPVLFEEASCLVKYGGHADQLSYQYWGMDRFRILALMKQLDSGSLPEDCVVATRAMLMQKLSILIMGATKRQQHEQVKCYEQQREKYRE
ncbi:MAG TPA: glycosyl transferase, partial [Coxiellaceae bacterium]|nr:glycosyl transferase [Coxiellaceae bacterium]